MNNYYVTIADLCIKIQNHNEVSNQVISDLNAIKLDEDINYDICLDIKNIKIKDYKAEIFSAKGIMNFNKNEYFVDYLSGVNYVVRNLFLNDKVDIIINANKSSLRKKIKGLYSNKSKISKNMILSYSLFWYVLHIRLLKQYKSFLHAGVVDNNGFATVITGTGGCGKTSTLFKILENQDTKYIAEDFGIVDKNGYTYYNPKPVSVYASDMEFGQSILKNYFLKFSKKEQLIWSIKRNIFTLNPMVKAKPNLLMKDRISKKSLVKNVIYFIRNNDEELSIHNIELNEIVERILDASMRELKTINELVQLIRANAPLDFNIPSFENIRDETKKIYLSAFAKTDNKIIYIPHKTKSNQLVNFLKEKGLV